MDRIEGTSTTQPVHHKHAHSPGDNPSIGAATLYGMALTAALFVPLGILIGIDRAPGSFYTYGLSCFVWPVASMVVLGGIVGAALGFTFGSIAHSSDDVPEVPATVNQKRTAPSRNHKSAWSGS